MQLRPYQEEILVALREQFKQGKRSVVLYAPTGAGKTETAIALLNAARQKQNRSAMILDRIVLVNQTSERLDKYAIDHGVMQSGHWRFRPYEYIQVCSAQTLERRGGADSVALLIVDECFVAGTKIRTPAGIREIDKVRVGDVVLNQCGVGVVEAVSIKSATETYKLEFDDGTTTECTGNHPFFTFDGWKTARDLVVGESFFGVEAVRLLWQNVSALDQVSRNGEDSFRDARISVEKAVKLLNILCKEIAQPDEQSSDSLKAKSATQRDQAQAYKAWRERALASFAAVSTSSCPGGWLGSRVLNSNENSSSENGLSDLLQDRYRQPDPYDCNRSRWWKSYGLGGSGERQEESRVSCFSRLVGISRIKRESPIAVFNLQVSGHPSYFADGRLVHNCHAVRRQTVEFIRANPQMKVVGLSATPFAKGMGKVYDGIVSTVTTKQLVDQGVLTPLKVFVSKEIDMTGAKKVAGEWTDAEASARAIKIVGDVVAEWIAKTHEIFGKPVKSIVFSCDVAHGVELSRKFQEHGYNFVCISYRDDDQFKADVIKDFHRPDTKIHGLIATDILTKGFDCPDVQIGISARPFSKSLGSHIQQMGRVMRGAPGKEFGVWLCFSGNYIRFREEWDDVYENGVHSLDDSREKPKKEKTEEEKQDSKCPQCTALWDRGSKSCVYCGYMRTRSGSVESVPGEMQELSAATKEDKQRWWAMCRYKVAVDGWSQGRAAHTYKDKFGVWPKGLDDNQFLHPDDNFEAFTTAQLKKYLRKVHAIRGKKK